MVPGPKPQNQLVVEWGFESRHSGCWCLQNILIMFFLFQKRLERRQWSLGFVNPFSNATQCPSGTLHFYPLVRSSPCCTFATCSSNLTSALACCPPSPEPAAPLLAKRSVQAQGQNTLRLLHCLYSQLNAWCSLATYLDEFLTFVRSTPYLLLKREY